MNERIYDIALEVLKDQPTLESWTFTREELEQLASLIIKDCTDSISNVECYPDSDWHRGVKEGLKIAVDTVIKNFGVEE